MFSIIIGYYALCRALCCVGHRLIGDIKALLATGQGSSAIHKGCSGLHTKG